MCYFFMVIKLLVLKILLNDFLAVITAARYDYGYHPSAEEYDNLLRETKRYWTHTFLKAERDKLLPKPAERNSNSLENRAIYDSRYFVPKFQYENNEAKKFNALKNTPTKPLQNIGSTLAFNYDSNELPTPMFSTTFKIQPAVTFNNKETFSISKPLNFNTTEIVVKPLVKPLVFTSQEHAFNDVKRNYSQESLPIYFTNPATGIVYAITELGRTHKNLTSHNGTIPIFITKEQHERDLIQLKNIYEQKCKNLRILTTTATPILRPQKPLANIISITSDQLTAGFTNTPVTKPLKKPPSVVVKTELTVKDKGPATPRPVRKRKNKTKPKPKPIIKKHKPPGHKTVSTTIRPLFANQPGGPAIILGTRTSTAKLHKNQENVATQLEKPNFENVFSAANAVMKTETQHTNQHHRVSKRSIENRMEKANRLNYLKHGKSLQKNFDKNYEILTRNRKENETKNLAKNYVKTSNAPINFLKRETFSHEPEEVDLKNFKKLSNNTIPPKSFKHQFQLNKKYCKKNFKLTKNGLNDKQLLYSRIKNLQKPQFSVKHKNKFLFETLNNKSVFQYEHNFKNIAKTFAKEPKLTKANIFYKNDQKNSGNQNQTFNKVAPIFNTSEKNSSHITHNNFNNNKLHIKTFKSTEVTKAPDSATTSLSKKALKTAKLFYKNLTSIKIRPQISWNDVKSNNTLVIKTGNKSFLNMIKVNEKQTLAKAYFKNKTLKDIKSKYSAHHITKRSAAGLTKVNTSSSDFKLITNKTLDITNNPEALKQQNFNQTQPKAASFNTTTKATTKSKATKLQSHINKQTKRFKHNKKLAKIKRNHTNYSRKLPGSHKRLIKKRKNMQQKSQGDQDTEYYLFDMEESYEEEDDEDEDEEDEDDVSAGEEEYADDGEEVVQGEANLIAYDDEPFATHTSEAGLSIEGTHDNSNQNILSGHHKYQENNLPEKHEAVLRPPPPLLDYDNDKDIDFKTKTSYIKKRFRRRPPQLKINKDYDYDEDDDEDDTSITSNLGGFFRMLLYPIQMIMGSVMDSFGTKDNSEEEDSPYTHYTSYHNTLKQQQQHHSTEDYNDYDDEYDANESSSSSLSNWFSSWFAFNRRNKKIGSTTVAPIKRKPTKASSSWLPSWLTFGANDRISTATASSEDYDEYDKWFASWFGEMKPKARKRTTTTTTSTTTQIPHVPILTIVDPLKNPQNWIGILAHHIINHTSTSTANPLKDIWNRVTTTTTENPEIPRKIAYDKYQIWRLKTQDESQVKALEEYKKSEDGIKLQWLKGPSLRGLTDVLVPPKMLVDFQASLTFELIDHEVLIFDVGKAIAYEKTKEDFFFTTTQKPKKHQGNKHPASMASMTWHKYYEYDDIIKYLETMRMRFPHLVELMHIGRSYEGRPLIVTKIESREAAAVNSAHYTAHQLNKLRHKKRIGLANAVFIEAGTHGMEWIGPATATWIINELLRIMKKNISDDQSFIRNTTWYILPVLNPDGYVYSHEFDRFWKKSRSRHISRPSGLINSAMTWLQKKRAREKVCFGVDLDRNWHYQWGRRGSSKSVCNEFYAGPTPFSEPETKALSEFLMDYRTQIKLFVSMQSYGQIISYPYKANTTYDSERLDELLDVAMVGTDNLRKKGSKSRYKIDSSNDLVENRSGCSDAFAAYEVGIPFSYTLQLADNGVHGYLLPSASIESTARDSFDIITGMLDYI